MAALEDDGEVEATTLGRGLKAPDGLWKGLEVSDVAAGMKSASADLRLAKSCISSLTDFGKAYGEVISRIPAFKALMAEDTVLPGLKDAVADAVSLGTVAEEFRKTIASASFAQNAASFRVMDQLAGEQLAYLKATSALSESIIGSGTITAWRAALQTESALGEIFKSSLFQTSTMSIWATDDFRKGLGATVRSQVHLTDWLVRADDGRSLLSAVSTSPLLRYRDYLGDLGVTPTRFELDATLYSGLGVNGLLGADALSSEDVQDDVDLETELADRVEELLLTPQQAGRLAVLEDLRSALARVDGTVVEMLEGGWAVVHEAPPAAAEMAAHCAVEAIDRALRAASPDAEVESWLPASGRPEKEWYSTNRRLTRAMRIRFIMRGHKGEASMASLMTDSLIALQKKTSDQAQAIKHASAGDLSKARGLLTTAESILTLIFLTT